MKGGLVKLNYRRDQFLFEFWSSQTDRNGDLVALPQCLIGIGEDELLVTGTPAIKFAEVHLSFGELIPPPEPPIVAFVMNDWFQDLQLFYRRDFYLEVDRFLAQHPEKLLVV